MPLSNILTEVNTELLFLSMQAHRQLIRLSGHEIAKESINKSVDKQKRYSLNPTPIIMQDICAPCSAVGRLPNSEHLLSPSEHIIY